jgi:hypothetical protein
MSAVVLLAAAMCPISRLGRAQQLKPLDSKSAKTEYSFAVRAGRPPLAIRAQIGENGKVGGALVFREGDPTAFQTLSSCQPDLVMELFQGDEDMVLVGHADFNFDGYEDLKLLQFYHPHLGKSIFCVYLWDEKAGRFRYEPQIPSPDPIPHPENKTITTHNEYFGGTHSDSVYVWIAGKVTEIATWGLSNEGDTLGRSKCPWTTYCDKRINGKMRTVTLKETGCDDTAPEEVTCTPQLRVVNAVKPRPK